jgi:hypothetical protein
MCPAALLTPTPLSLHLCCCAVGALCIAALGLLLYRRHARHHPRGATSADEDKLGALVETGGGKLLGSAGTRSSGTP